MSEHVCDITGTLEGIDGIFDGHDSVRVRERVVRCRECAHWGGLWDWDEAIGCDLADLPQADPNGFCAWGERRDDAQM